MWLMTQIGFYSLVEKSPGVFHVRSRERVDLENLVAQVPLEAEIIETPHNDYAARIIVDQEAVSKIMAFLAKNIDYDNFKNRIHATPDQAHKPYSKVWSVIEEAARKRAGR